MEDKPSFRPYLVPAIFMLVIGWGGLALLLNFSVPTIWPRWGFFALIVLAAAGTATPVSFWLNNTFRTNPPAEPAVIVRESVSAGVYFALLAWLSIGRILNFSIAAWLALALVFIEYLLRIRETSTKSENVPPQPPIG
jgi:ABC-type uncharacterized transport system permease subunit